MRKNEGITLIALVITIIVVLLISGVSISMLIGENGILTKVNQAKEENQKSTIEEKIKIAVMGSISINGDMKYENLKKNLNKINNISGVPDIIDESSFPIVLQSGDIYMKITSNGEVKDAKLPQEYQKVEYIQSTGTQYIDTGINNDFTGMFDIEFSSSTTRQLMGLNTSGGNYWGSNENNHYEIGPNSGNVILDSDTTKRNIVTFMHSNTDLISKLTVEDITLIRVPLIADYNNFKIFSADSGAYKCFVKLYRAKFYKNNLLVRDFIPCYSLKINDIGLYDLVNDVFYTNKGTGTFLKGNDI